MSQQSFPLGRQQTDQRAGPLRSLRSTLPGWGCPTPSDCPADLTTVLLKTTTTLHRLPGLMLFFLFKCYLFHMYVGVRAGGGIGDEIEDPAGDPYEMYRIVFDITFFFFVIVILLAIIQGMAASLQV